MEFNTHFVAEIAIEQIEFNSHFVSDISAKNYFNSHFVSDINNTNTSNTHFLSDINITQLINTHFVADINRYFPFNISLVLEGASDSLPDFEYRMKSFSTSQNSGDNSTFNFQMPKQAKAISAYNARPNGDLVVYYLGNEIIRCNPERPNYNIGATSQTFSVKGSKQETYTNPKTITITDNRVSNISTSSTGKRVFTVLDFIDINPLDSITYDSETIQIEKFSLTVGTTGFKYSLTEL